GAFDFELHQVMEGGAVAVVRDVVFADVEQMHIFEWQIDAALDVVGGYILPEIGELQGGTSEVGKLLALRVAISAEIQDEVSNGVRGIFAVGQQVGERGEASDGLILAEG